MKPVVFKNVNILNLKRLTPGFCLLNPLSQNSSFLSGRGLKQRIKKLETENYALRNHLEVVYGMAEPELIKKIEVLQAENEELRKQLQQLNFLKDFEN